MPQGIKPEIVILELNEKYGKFSIEPLERGFGHTLGNALAVELIADHATTVTLQAELIADHATFKTVVDELVADHATSKTLQDELILDHAIILTDLTDLQDQLNACLDVLEEHGLMTAT